MPRMQDSFFKMTRGVAGLIAALMLMTAHGVAVAQVTAVTGTVCQTPVLQNPSTLNPLRLQAGTVTFELWGTTSISATNVASLFQVTGLQSVELLALRTAAQNVARGCPSLPSASLRLRTADTITSTVSGSLTVPHAKSGQTIALRMVPLPDVSWIWSQTPVGSTTPCVMPSFAFQYSPNTVLNLKIPFNAALGVECKQQLSSRIFAGKSDAHIVGPVPVRLTTQLTGLPSVDLPLPIAPESTMPSQVDRPGSAVGVAISLSKNGVLRRNRDFPLAITTPNGKTGQLSVSIVRLPEDLSYRMTITGWVNPPDRTGLGGETTPQSGTIGVFPTVPFDVLFNIDPAVREFSLPITWRLTNSACFTRFARAGSASFNPGSVFQTHNLPQGQKFFEVVLIPSSNAGCVPAPGQFRDDTLEVWAGSDTSRAPNALATVRVTNPTR